MSDVVISSQRISKRYTLAHQASRTAQYVARRDAANLRLVLENGIRHFGAKTLALAKGGLASKVDQSETFWALSDVSFDVRRGEVLGIIGRNGAGKSTLLKILSRIIDPTGGRAVLRGRVASLLEVGTGFHPELTARENIFLNGAILGMSRVEITSKFEEIVEFAEVSRFLDTPVKHFSSGMYVRLAFAVSAHLESEVLIVDEVLAVGDVDFQRKCLGKMRDVSTSGRTVLLVSHNMAAIRTLATRCIVLSEGKIVFDGDSTSAIKKYSDVVRMQHGADRYLGVGERATIENAKMIDDDGHETSSYVAGTSLKIDLRVVTDGAPGLSLEVILRGAEGQKLALSSLQGFHGGSLPREAGTYRVVLELEPIWIASGSYSLDVAVSIINSRWDHYVEDAIVFQVPSCNRGNHAWDFKQSYQLGNFAIGFADTPKFELISGTKS